MKPKMLNKLTKTTNNYCISSLWLTKLFCSYNEDSITNTIQTSTHIHNNHRENSS